MRIYITSLLMLLMLLLLPVMASAYDFEVDGIYYSCRSLYPGTVEVTESPSSNKYSGDIIIPETVTYNGTTYTVEIISYRAFSGCSGLSSVTIGNSVSEVRNHAFAHCDNLSSVSIGSAVISIENNAFSYTPNLAHLVVASDNSTYDTRDDCNAVIYSATNVLVAGCRSTVIPSSVAGIWNGAFTGCSGLVRMDIPNSVIVIDNDAFKDCSGLTSVTIPASVISIGKGAFSGCSALTSLTVENGNTKYDCRENCNAIIETTSNTLITGCQNTVIPSSVTSISGYAFAGCSKLTSLIIPNSVTSIGEYAFMRCSALTNLAIPASVTAIEEGLFLMCSGLTSMTIPKSIISIGKYAFVECSGLNSVTIPASVTSIGVRAFWNCSGLTDVYCHITDPSGDNYSSSAFYLSDNNYSGRTLHVPQLSADAYNSWYPYFGQIVDDLTPTFTGVIEYPVIEVVPEKSTGLDKIFVVYDTDGVKMNFTSTTDDTVTWERFDYNSGQLQIEEITDITHTGNVTTLNQVIPNTGYRITDGTNIYYYWVVNYSDYNMELNDFHHISAESCNLTTLNIDGHAGAIPYYAVNGRRQELDRNIKLSYHTLVWDDIYDCWQEQETVESFAYLNQQVEILPPLCNTSFMLTGDRFLEEWGIEETIESEYYQTQAVDCRSTAEQDYSVYDYSDDLGGWAPCHIVFSGYPTDAVVYRAWEMATDAEFENVIMRFNQDEVDYTFMDAGTYYMRYMVTNEDGSCNAYGNSHVIKVKSFPIRGDVNGDREVNIADINAVIDIILGSDVSDYVRSRADVNSDGEVNIADINVIIDIILKGQPAVSAKDWVDLGLPSGTLWATCNVGANCPEEYGDYFAWGETFSKDYYDWTTYKWCIGGMDGITKYGYGVNGFADFKSELEPEDDVAYVHWGPSWRMPTLAQQDELREHCTWTWTTQNGVNGYLVIGPNGNSIFLPVAGNSCEELPCNAESGGFYWSRTLNIEINQVAYFLYFDSENVRLSCHNRSLGFPVRAVCVPQN